MKKIILAAALILSSAAASAGTITTSCYRYESTLTCQTTASRPHVGSMAKIIAVPEPETAEEIQARAATERKWEAFCKPTKYVDSFGLTRMSYAHKNCDLGRTQ